jgi:S1-C subfamily serine protease
MQPITRTTGRLLRENEMKKCLFLLAAILLVTTGPNAQADAIQGKDVQDAIVKIYTYHDVPDYQNPWSRRGTFSSTGSGCIISGNRILSNAHVVSDRTFIQVRRHGESRRYPARVISVAHAVDLALLTVDDPEFFEGAEPLTFGELPFAQQEVLVYGFPLGGDSLSTTRGVVSRVEHQVYAHSSCRFIAAQIDAAINPGNSGGPAIISNRIVGVVMQGITKADNIGYIVPAPIIRHFMDDIEDGQYDGFPSLGVIMQGMENADLKEKYGMDRKQTGMLITLPVRGSAADGVLQPGDVLLSVEGHAVADDGTVEFRPRERTSVSYYIQEKQIGDPLNVEVLRHGAVTSITVRLNRPMELDWLVPMEMYDIQPRYYVYGGLVFCPVTVNLLRSWGGNWFDSAPKELVAMLGNNYLTDERDEVVLMLKILAANVNQGYQDFSMWVVDAVDGTPVTSLKHLVELVETETDEPFVTFSNKNGKELVLDRARAKSAKADILKTYRIPADRHLEIPGPPPAPLPVR